jgi:hypothetical protein
MSFFFADKFEWGSPCKDLICVGIFLPKKVVRIKEPVRWRWAVKNLDGKKKSLVIYDDQDRQSRVKLEIFLDKNSIPIQEWAPTLDYERINNPVTLVLPPLVIDLKENRVHKFETVTTLHELEPGSYWVRLLFGGSGFSFKCTSTFVQLKVRP